MPHRSSTCQKKSRKSLTCKWCFFRSKAPYLRDCPRTGRVPNSTFGNSGTAGVGAEGTPTVADPAGKKDIPPEASDSGRAKTCPRMTLSSTFRHSLGSFP